MRELIGMDYARGLAAMKAALPGQYQAVLMTLADRLADNLRGERVFGSTETRRAERAAIVYELNELALQVLQISFNELCAGMMPPFTSAPSDPSPSAASPWPPAAKASPPEALPASEVSAKRASIARVEALPLRVFPTLEVRILPRQAAGYPVRLVWNDPNQADLKIFKPGYLAAEVVPWRETGDLAADGSRLFQELTHDWDTSYAWATAKGASAQRRICLNIDVEALELHALPWELLYEEDVGFVASSPDTPFSRLMPTYKEWAAVQEPPVRVLVAMANPRNLSDYNLAPLQTLDRSFFVQWGLERIAFDVLDAPVTLAHIGETLHEGRYQVLHIMAHGMFSRRTGEGALLLADNAGNACPVDKEAIQKLFMGLLRPNRPRLVFLAVCESAVMPVSTTEFASLGPHLGSVGVPLVIAMQDRVSLQGAQRLAEVFYKRLAAHGIVDFALNEARAVLGWENSTESAIPVLYMRPGAARLWDV